MHVLFLAPDTHAYNHEFLRGLKTLGVRVSGVGPAPADRVSPGATRWLDAYQACGNALDVAALTQAAEQLHRQAPIDRVETIDEPLVEPAAHLRARWQLPGLSVETARLCRDKVAMKALLRQHGIPCAHSIAAASADEIRAFTTSHGFPIIIKPVAGFGSLDTHRVNSMDELDQLLRTITLSPDRRVAVEEFVEGHEGFYDTITDEAGVRHDFAGHYYPGCLEANRQRWISPQIAVTNRLGSDGYRELRTIGQRVVEVLGIRNSATHMEWFFGPKGLKFSEIGARPAGEKIWDMYRAGNDFDVYREWALAVLGRPAEQQPSRRLATGSVQVRPDRDGRVQEHSGIDAVWQRCRPWIYEFELPPRGSLTKPLDKGWLVNVWFRLRHSDYDELRRLMTFIGETAKTKAQ